jgi:hypothetical protein
MRHNVLRSRHRCSVAVLQTIACISDKRYAPS